MDVSGRDELIIQPLGGGQEVGRSCHLLQYASRQLLLDCGCHPGRSGMDSLPFFDSLDNPSAIDAVLITHFHIDHCAALPYFTEHTSFNGKVYMTHATKAVMKLLLFDNIRLQSRQQALYTEEELQSCLDKIEVLDYHQTVDYKGMKFTATPAGHVLGAAMFTIDIDNIRVLYTGDYSLEEDRHLSQAEIPPGRSPDVLIVESTFGITAVAPRDERESKFTAAVESIVTRGGSCLIPVFALGRAQELLLILDEYWSDNPNLQTIPIFYASKLATRSLRVYQTFVNMMNAHVRELSEQFMNPFQLKHINKIQNSDVQLFGPAVVMASPGFLQSGVSRQLFEEWCDDEKNGVIIAGYTIEGTLANELLSLPTEIRCMDNRIKPRRCQIEYISFSAHVDFNQNRTFIRSVLPDYIVLVHGEKTHMRRLKEALDSEIKSQWPTTHNKTFIAMPENGARVVVPFRKSIAATVVGSAADSILADPDAGENVDSQTTSLPEQALLVTENFTSKLVSASELGQHTACRFGQITERFNIPIPTDIAAVFAQSRPGNLGVDAPLDDESALIVLGAIANHLMQAFDEVVFKGTHELQVQGLLAVTLNTSESSSPLLPSSKKTLPSSAPTTPGRLTGVLITWVASPLTDVVADSLASLLMQFFAAHHLVRLSLQSSMASSPKIVTGEAESVVKKPRVDPPVPSSDVAIKTEFDEEWESLAEKMRKGEIDPSKLLTLPSGIAGNTSSQLEQLATQFRALPSFSTYFSDVKLTTGGDRLIFRGLENTIYQFDEDTQTVSTSSAPAGVTSDVEIPEAFSFVLFDRRNPGENPSHHAVVQSSNEAFRRAVLFTFSLLIS